MDIHGSLASSPNFWYHAAQTVLSGNVMTYQTVYSDDDFPQMGWHDAAVYSMTFPRPHFFTISFDIDYIFKWHKTEVGTHYRGWDVAPCTLTFQNVSGLKVAVDWSLRGGINQGDTAISNVRRQNSRLSPNGEFVCWGYEIELDVGLISFEATGFEQIVRVPPKFSESQHLGRADASEAIEIEGK
ncbi:hypothetical protein [Peteryoungia ipomoeae]|uniref:Uncharacterized protein n=1 Tax=Peteryoungia ipomoeae TaxID=1210932 RepID=A0A4V4HMY2_9HYPH|nr:hypothetical protein [Peteryoungia ipomoeae]THV23876.1 hypothetical protein FAA97_07795 [Peteryoungia ipomoeae]